MPDRPVRSHGSDRDGGTEITATATATAAVTASAVAAGPDGRPRCRWSTASAELLDYHDREWGFPVDDDHRLFEKLSLEGFQSGLSWRTVLAKRARFRQVLCGFDFDAIAELGDDDIARLVQDPGIIRHRGKIEAVLNNARRAQELVAREGSLAAFVWGYQPDEGGLAPPQSVSSSPGSIALSKELKRRGWTFVGPTTVYAFMQAMGLVNDHVEPCVIRPAVARRRKAFRPPGP